MAIGHFAVVELCVAILAPQLFRREDSSAGDHTGVTGSGREPVIPSQLKAMIAWRIGIQDELLLTRNGAVISIFLFITRRDKSYAKVSLD